MRRIAIVVLFSSFFSFNIFSQVKNRVITEKIKVGFIQADTILVKLNDYQSQVKIYEKYKKQLTDEFESNRVEIESRINDYIRKEKNYTGEQLNIILQEVQEQQQHLNSLAQTTRQKIQLKEMEIIGPLKERILKAVNIVAKSEGYTHVLAQNSFYFVLNSFDLTDRVIVTANKL